MSNRLAGKVIAVVGASSGIGLATSRQCAEEGAQVIMMARGRSRLDEAAAELEATSVPCDVADPGSVSCA